MGLRQEPGSTGPFPDGCAPPPEPLSPWREPPKPSLSPGLPGLVSSRSRPLPLPGRAPHPPAPERPLPVTCVWMKGGAGPWSLRVSHSLPLTAGAGARESPLIHPGAQDKDWWRDP